MDFHYKLKKPLPTRRSVEATGEPTVVQVVLAERITDAVLRLLRDHLTMSGHEELFGSGKPFELFEVCDDLCDALGLERQCAVLLELTNSEPKLVWNDDDLVCLQQKPIDHLRRIQTAIANHIATDGSFASLMAE